MEKVKKINPILQMETTECGAGNDFGLLRQNRNA